MHPPKRYFSASAAAAVAAAARPAAAAAPARGAAGGARWAAGGGRGGRGEAQGEPESPVPKTGHSSLTKYIFSHPPARHAPQN